MAKQIKIKFWKKIICFFAGHSYYKEKELESNNMFFMSEINQSIEFFIQKEAKHITKMIPCKRCGITFENYIEHNDDHFLTENDKIVRDIII